MGTWTPNGGSLTSMRGTPMLCPASLVQRVDISDSARRKMASRDSHARLVSLQGEYSLLVSHSVILFFFFLFFYLMGFFLFLFIFLKNVFACLKMHLFHYYMQLEIDITLNIHCGYAGYLIYIYIYIYSN